MKEPKPKPKVLEPRVADARFIASGGKCEDLPESGLVEIAFAGRSNVGKSSLLNSLLQRRTLVRTSKTPGATRAINLFETKLASGEDFVFADLPGYGFAHRSKTERAGWGPMLEGYLRKREQLSAIVLLLDVRRGVQDDDVELARFAASLATPERPLHLVVCLTKIDKLPVSKRKPELLRVRRALGKSNELGSVIDVIGYSAVTHDGRERLWKVLRDVRAAMAKGDASIETAVDADADAVEPR